MASSFISGKLRKLHSSTKPAKRGLSEHIQGRTASFQSLQAVFEGAFGDDTAALSKELQQATPRQSSYDGDSTFAVTGDGGLDSLLDCMADLSTRGGSVNDTGGSGSGIGSPLFGGNGFFDDAHPPGVSPKWQPPEEHSSVEQQRWRHSGGLQVVPVRGVEDAAAHDRHSPTSARSSDTGGFADWCLPAARQDSMESCGGSPKKGV